MQNQAPVPVAAILYAWAGLAAVIGGFTTGGVRLAALGVITIWITFTLAMWKKLTAHVASLGRHQATLLLPPPVFLALTFIFNRGGMVENQFRGDFVDYWPSWMADPFIPLLSVPFAALPLYAG